MTPFYFNKLVREKIIQHMKSSNATVYTKTLSQDEYAAELKRKLLEEAEEVYATNTKKELLEELSDVQVAIHALAQAMDITMEEVEAKRIEKLQEKGTFSRQGM